MVLNRAKEMTMVNTRKVLGAFPFVWDRLDGYYSASYMLPLSLIKPHSYLSSPHWTNDITIPF